MAHENFISEGRDVGRDFFVNVYRTETNGYSFGWNHESRWMADTVVGDNKNVVYRIHVKMKAAS